MISKTYLVDFFGKLVGKYTIVPDFHGNPNLPGVLVEQQAQYCREKCQRKAMRVIELAGGEMDNWEAER